MSERPTETTFSELPCCPELAQQSVCDTLDFRYRFPFRARVGDDNRQVVPVEVVLHFQFQRCSGPLVIGDPVYTTTLLPGEKVRIFTSDRHSRWSYDSESNLAYRHETTSEESFYTAGMAQAMSDLTVSERGSAASTYGESWAEGRVGGGFSFLGLGASASSSFGSYDAHSTSAFARSLARHARSASRYVAAGVRAKSATSIGEVEQRTHAEGESQAHYESSSRMFSNPNKCRAVTYLFYKLNKLQKVRFRLVAIERRIDDPSTPTGAYQREPVDTTGRVTVLPQTISATSKDRLEVEEMARVSAARRREAVISAAGPATAAIPTGAYYAARVALPRSEPSFSPELREAALKAVDKELAEAGLLDLETGKPTKEIIAELSWKRKELLPTPGVIVRGCLDHCDTCEPALKKEIHLDLERKHLENELLKKQIDLLEQSQEYRCCPAGSEETEEP